MGEDKSIQLAQPIKSCLEELAGWFNESSMPYTTIGGIAVSMISEPRFTRDIDAVIWIDRDDWPAFIEQAIRHGFIIRNQDPIDFAQLHRIFLLTHLATGINIDISLGALPFESEMIERSNTADIGHFKIKVPTPEDLIVMKVIAGRPKDMADVDSILRIYKITDVKRMRFWISEFSNVLEMPEIKERFERILKNNQ